MTNFIQPTWTLTTKNGANQAALYCKLPRTQAGQNLTSFGRDKPQTFKFKVQYPDAKEHKQNGFSNIRPTTVTASQNQTTGTRLYNTVNAKDPRTDNTKSKPYEMENMRVQASSFNNNQGGLIAIGALLLGVLFLSRR